MASHGRERIEDDEVAALQPAEQALGPLQLGGGGDASGFVARLAMTEPVARRRTLHRLQAGAGNRAVGRMISSGRSVARTQSSGSFVVSRPFEVSLAMGPSRATPAPAIRGASPDGKYSHNPTPPEAIPVAEAPGPGAAEAARRLPRRRPDLPRRAASRRRRLHPRRAARRRPRRPVLLPPAARRPRGRRAPGRSSRCPT